MKMLPRSITGRLVLWLSLGTAVVLATAGVFLFSEVRAIVIDSVDRSLHSKRQMITGLLHEEHGGIELELSEIIAGEYAIPRSGHYYRVRMDNALLAASPSLVDDAYAFLPTGPVSAGDLPGESLYTSVGPDDEPVRVLRYRHRAFGKEFDITLAESLVDSLAMIATFGRYLILAVPLMILVLCLAAWRIAKASLSPVVAFSETIETTTHRNLSRRIDAEANARELARLAQAFNAMLDRLNRVFESQKRLVADASHELKTPVSVIRTQCDVALQRARTVGEYAEILSSIRSSSRSMADLINDLLSLARLDAGMVSPENFAPVSVADCVRDAVRPTEVLADERSVTVSAFVDEGLYVNGSRSSLSEAFLNLVSNAVKYTAEHGSVFVSARGDNGKAVITVSDTGQGIGAEDQERIFERFYRADWARATDGTGLGLSIAKSVVEAHGGEIFVESVPGKGSRFTISIPALVNGGRRSARGPS